ncbi:MAG: ADP-dependent glucokinase/phosphofructokinase [Propionibacteriales bacterium]|nr:ADP-dependent glucokinase/phosphofructokinase [Propionibacteriales bacterium]
MNHPLVLGLGGCVDFEIVWDADVLTDLAREHHIGLADLDPTVPIQDERSLLCSLLGFLRADQGGERFVASSQVAIDFAERFTYKVSLGGTCVRAALAIAKLGVPSLVHLVSIDDNVRRLLPPGIDYLCSAEADSLDPHVIVQFPAGARVAVIDGEVASVHPNRIIYVNDPPNRDLVLSQELPAALAGARAFLPAGFNVMTDPGLLRQRLTFLQAAMRKLPDEAVVFYEDSGFHHQELRDIVSREFSGRIDVHSLNEDELQTYLGRRVDLLDVVQVKQALADFFHGFSIAPTVVVHTKYWALAFGKHPRRYCDALAAAIDLAGVRYCCGDDFTADDLAAVQALPARPDGQRFAAALTAELGEAVCCVPTRLIETDTPTTIGLGDTFVGGFLAALLDEEWVC